MLGLVLSLVVSAVPTVPSAAVSCPGWPATCDGAALPLAASTGDGDEGDGAGPREYATPAEIDCPTPPVANGPIASGECDGAPLDLWYRVSRLPDSERPAGSLMPMPRRSRAAHGSASGGRPADPGQLSAPDLKPAVLFAPHDFVATVGRGLFVRSTDALPARVVAPPDRPPRA
ncbi:MAG TPA: hypothetical protein VFG23_24490 [Polyangia bacterium]|nr:hypothetical protein [Polyangia bacterium]